MYQTECITSQASCEGASPHPGHETERQVPAYLSSQTWLALCASSHCQVCVQHLALLFAEGQTVPCSRQSQLHLQPRLGPGGLLCAVKDRGGIKQGSPKVAVCKSIQFGPGCPVSDVMKHRYIRVKDKNFLVKYYHNAVTVRNALILSVTVPRDEIRQTILGRRRNNYLLIEFDLADRPDGRKKNFFWI